MILILEINLDLDQPVLLVPKTAKRMLACARTVQCGTVWYGTVRQSMVWYCCMQLVDVVPEIGALVDRKYQLLVSSQVYAKAASSQHLTDRWRAHGVQLLMSRYPALKVAYLEPSQKTAVFQVCHLLFTLVSTGQHCRKLNPASLS